MHVITVAVAPFAPQLFALAMRMADTCALETAEELAAARADATGGTRAPELGHAVVALELVQTLVIHLGGDFMGPLIAASTLLAPGGLLEWACATHSADMELSAFALVGELASYAWPVLAPAAPRLLRAASDAIVAAVAGSKAEMARRDGGSSNALWAAGMVYRKLAPADAAAVAPALLPGFKAALLNRRAPPNMVANAAVNVCVMAAAAPAVVLAAFTPPRAHQRT